MTSVVEPCGPVTIRTVSAFHERLTAVCDEEGDVVLDLSGTDDVDLSFVQILYAARRHMADEGRTLRLAAPAPSLVAALLRRAGFLSDPSGDDIDFWFHGELPQ